MSGVAVAGVTGELARAVFEAKGRDPLAPVTVVCPNWYSTILVRRVMAGSSGPGGRAGVANLNTTTLSSLIQDAATPTLASTDMRPVSALVQAEAIRTEALERGGWVGRFAGHERALASLEMSLRELGRCPPGALNVIGSQSPQAAEIVSLLHAVRRRLHGSGFADEHDVAEAAIEAIANPSTSGLKLGTVLTWELGRCSVQESEILDRLGARAVFTAGDPTGSLTPRLASDVFSCPDAEEEARAAVRTVLRSAEEGTPLWLQAIFHPPSRSYPRLLHQHLAAAGLASSGHGMRRLATVASARALLGFLELADRGWARDEVVAWMSSAPIALHPEGRPVPVVQWDVLSAEAGVISGSEQWSERLANHAIRCDPDAGTAGDLAAFVAELVRRSEPPGPAWSDHARWATEIFDRFINPSVARGTWPAEEQAGAEQVRESLEGLADLDQVSASTDLPAFRLALKAQLERTELDLGEIGQGRFGDGVFVAPLQGSRGLRFWQVVICGLADAIVPGPAHLDSLLGEEVRLSDTSGTLRTRARVHEDLRDDLDCALRSGTRSRVATYPRCDPRSGRTHVPSRWLEDLASGAEHHTVASFAGSLAGDGPALDTRDLELRTLERWVGFGADAAASPVVSADSRLETGFQAIRARAASTFSRFDGYVGAGRVSPFDPEMPVSATRFETYAHCPRRFLLERALAIGPRVLPEELWRIEPLERGSLVHEILEEYVAERVSGAERSLERLLSIAGAHLDRASARGLVGKRLLWRMDRAAIVRDLRRFHVEEGDLQPLAVELAFGSEDDEFAPPVIVKLEDGREVHFRGSADRVDRSASGRLVVSDYKTGKQARLADLIRDPVAAGTLLQLPLYGLAARERFGSEAPVHARYWLLSSERSASFYNLALTDTVEARFKEVIGRIASGVESGCFPGVPGAPMYDKQWVHCRNCDFDRLCPPQRDRQWTRKSADPKLDDVVALMRDDGEGRLSGTVVKGFVDPNEFDFPTNGDGQEAAP